MDTESIKDYAGQLVDMFRQGNYDEVVKALIEEDNCLLIVYMFYYLEDGMYEKFLELFEEAYNKKHTSLSDTKMYLNELIKKKTIKVHFINKGKAECPIYKETTNLVYKCFNPWCNLDLTGQEIRNSKYYFAKRTYCKNCLDELELEPNEQG